MSSRQQEKARRRAERIAREQAEARAAARRKRLQLTLVGLLALIAAGGVAVAIAARPGSGGGGSGEAREVRSDLPKLPVQQTSDLDAAAKAAGCRVINAASEGAGHADKTFTARDYRTNPPTSGTHFPEWAEDGVYDPGSTPELGKTVHALEHGRVNVQYKPGTPRDTIAKLEALLAEQNDGYHMLLFQNQSGMPYQVAMSAWTHALGCRRFNDTTIDALRSFRMRYIDKGPEQVP
jgi:hypothetical protein